MSAYLEGELPAHAHHRVEGHVGVCPRVARGTEGWRTHPSPHSAPRTAGCSRAPTAHAMAEYRERMRAEQRVLVRVTLEYAGRNRSG